MPAKTGIPIPHNMVTTGMEIPQYYIMENYGVVRGITVRSRDFMARGFADFRAKFGGKIGGYVKLCEEAREEAYGIVIRHAYDIGANAIICFRYDSTLIVDGMTEFMAYGTAVKAMWRG